MALTFGEYIKELRAARRLTLRAFSAAAGVDPANYSKLERGLLAPPDDPERLRKFELILGLPEGGAECRELRRLAALGRGELPPAVLADRELVGKLPALFRTLEGDPVDDQVLEELVETLRRE
jgi:transcriptional regulator with XRE-family HTH domain